MSGCVRPPFGWPHCDPAGPRCMHTDRCEIGRQHCFNPFLQRPLWPCCRAGPKFPWKRWNALLYSKVQQHNSNVRWAVTLRMAFHPALFAQRYHRSEYCIITMVLKKRKEHGESLFGGPLRMYLILLEIQRFRHVSSLSRTRVTYVW